VIGEPGARGTGVRDVGVDVLRGVALVSMYVAHTAPDSRLSAVLNLSEYLTYPLFAALVGMGAVLGSGRSFGATAVRGGVLVVWGLLLERLDADVVVVLVYLGLLTWVVFPLAKCRTAVVAVVGAAALVAAPPIRHACLDLRTDLYLHGHASAARLLDYLVTGDEYRLLSMVGFAAGGMVVLRLVRSGLLTRSRQVAVGTALLLVTGAYGVLVQHAGQMQPYEATWREHAFCLLLVVSTMLLGLGVAPQLGPLSTTLAAMGRMALTLYVLQVCYLSAWSDRHPGVPDDRWSNTLVLVVGSVVLALVWPVVVRGGRFWRGPLEGVTQLLVDAHRGAASRRSGPIRTSL
jgi:uncharacterized membrane protein